MAQLDTVKEAHKMGHLAVPTEVKDMHKAGLKVKHHTRLYVCVDFLLEHVLHEAPKDAASRPAFAQQLEVKLAAKGMEPPRYMQELLATMQKKEACATQAEPG